MITIRHDSPLTPDDRDVYQRAGARLLDVWEPECFIDDAATSDDATLIRRDPHHADVKQQLAGQVAWRIAAGLPSDDRSFYDERFGHDLAQLAGLPPAAGPLCLERELNDVRRTVDANWNIVELIASWLREGREPDPDEGRASITAAFQSRVEGESNAAAGRALMRLQAGQTVDSQWRGSDTAHLPPIVDSRGRMPDVDQWLKERAQRVEEPLFQQLTAELQRRRTQVVARYRARSLGEHDVATMFCDLQRAVAVYTGPHNPAFVPGLRWIAEREAIAVGAGEQACRHAVGLDIPYRYGRLDALYAITRLESSPEKVLDVFERFLAIGARQVEQHWSTVELIASAHNWFGPLRDAELQLLITDGVAAGHESEERTDG